MRYWAIVALTLSCVPSNVEQPPGYPLYPNSGARMPRDRVAELEVSMPGGASVGGGNESFIQSVDDQDVSSMNGGFELLPGCHLVKTSSRLLIANGMLTWHGQMAPRLFAFQMRPGNTYIVKLELIDSGNGNARIAVNALEQDSAGAQVRRIEAVKGVDEIRACEAYVPAAAAPATP